MKKFKTLLSMLLVLTMVFALCSCGSNDGADGDSVTLTWMIPVSQQPDEELVETEVNKIVEKELGVKLDLVFIDASAFQERMNMNMASGEDFDLCFTGYVNKYQKAVYNRGLLELDDLLNEHVPKLMEDMPAYAWDVAKMEGHIYAVPNLQGFAPPTAVMLFGDLTEKYDFDATKIEHIEDLEPYFEKLVKNEPGIIPWRLDYGYTHWTDPVWESIQSGVVIRRDGSSKKVEIIYETDEYKDAISTLHQWYKKGYLQSDLVSAQPTDLDFKAGKYAGRGCGWLPGSEANLTNTYKRPMIVAPITEPYMTKSLSLAAMTGIGANSKHPIEALKVIELVNTNQELLTLLSIGIKDKHYTLNEDGKYTLIPDSGYVTAGTWIFGNQFKALLSEGQQDGVWEETAQMNIDAVKSPLLGFTLDTEPIKNEISQVSAVSGEFQLQAAIVNNNADYDKMMKKLKEAGLDKIKKEVQRQIDEYFKTQK